eukprot:TRINITY_DN1833_c0_g1_i4.p1 TRINITY_DN1833_c0_g1~~TRINITY_DN1833_c0_g1_i4.p1  ORF type:complete len:289 (+),score=103.38 TRINITY_DN1833_c0_g1_i4:36-902(+)
MSLAKNRAVQVAGMALGIGGLLYCLLKKKRKVALKGSKEKVELVLIDIEKTTHNTRIFTFALPTTDSILGLPIGNHVSVSANIDGKLVSRAYTPISSDVDIGVIKLAIKVYPNGAMTQHMEKMSLSDTLAFKGPTGHFTYHGKGHYTITKKGYPEGKQQVNSFAMLAGGTGITPCLQVIEAIHRDPEDKTKVFLIFANMSVDDILLRDRLEQLQQEREGQFNFWFTLDKAPEGWEQGVGFITEQMVRDHLGPVEGSLALMCGPPPMIKYACHPNLDAVGYDKHAKFEF